MTCDALWPVAVFSIALTITILLTSTTAIAQKTASELPPDVAALISRRASCEEWSQKRAVSADYNEPMWAPGCDSIGNDEVAIRDRYANDQNVLAALDAQWAKVVKRLPVHKIER